MRFPLVLVLRPSRAARASVIAMHMLAALALFHFPVETIWRAAGVLVLLASCRHGLARERARQGCSMVLERDGSVSATIAGESLAIGVQPGIVDFGWMLWFSLRRLDGGRLLPAWRHLMLVPDNLPPGHWRLLRIWLRHCAASRFNADA